MAEEKIKSVSPIVSQIVLKKLGMYSSERLSVDIYYLLECVNLLIPDLGEDYIKKRYEEQGKNWDEIKTRLNKINKYISKVKTFYDPIKDKKFEKSFIDPSKTQLMFKRYFFKTAGKVALIQKELYDLFIFLVKISTLQKQTIPSDAFKIIEHTGFRKIETPKRPGSTEKREV